MDYTNPIASLLEGAYAMTPTHPGFWLKFEDLCRSLTILLTKRGLSVEDVEECVRKCLSEAKFNEDYTDKYTGEKFLAIQASPKSLKQLNLLRRAIEKAVGDANTDSEGWVKFAEVGNHVSRDLFQPLGFDALSQAVMAIFPSRMEFRKGDISKREAPLYVRDKKEKQQPAQPATTKVPRSASSTNEDSRALLKFAYFLKPRDFETGNGINAAIEELRKRALPERWYYNESDKERSYILRNYIFRTFDRLLHEDEQETEAAEAEKREPQLKIIESEEYAIWNTGLVDNLYDPIYAFFKRNDRRNANITQKWIFLCFNTANSQMNTTTSRFRELPRKASYFQNPRELLYDTSAGEPMLNWEHLIGDNIERFPLGFVMEGANKDFVAEEHPHALPPEERKAYFRRLAEAINADARWKRRLTNDFKEALHTTLARVDWNYKTAIPVYYPREQKMQLLLPLALENSEVVDAALLCNHRFDETQGVNNYEGRTILTLAMAYDNARLIARPDSNWLTFNAVQKSAEREEEDLLAP
jgi:hypothetical protein